MANNRPITGKYIDKMPDGTIKQLNPFTGTEVWTVPGRAGKPITNEIPKNAKKIERHTPEDYCNFCASNYLNTPPEKSRLIKENDKYKILYNVPAQDLSKTVPLLRRIPNLFEIVSYDYWVKNYSFFLPPDLVNWKNSYMSTQAGQDHVFKIIDMKITLLGKDPQKISRETKLDMADAFFGGCHELVVANKHYSDTAEYDSQLCSSGELTPEEHFLYIKFTIEAIKAIHQNNRYVRYISVFQNWLSSAGASFDHLHKQLVAIDEWGTSIEDESELVRGNPNIYNELAANYAGYQNLVFAENDYAVAFADFGHRFPTIAVYSKSSYSNIWELSDDEIKGFSDIVHGCHAAMGSRIPCNEEWYYKPLDADYVMPWHILIKWRVNTPAGFEGGTKIYINTIDPVSLRDKMVPRLFELKNQGKIAKFNIAFECPCLPNSLKYNPAVR